MKVYEAFYEPMMEGWVIFQISNNALKNVPDILIVSFTFIEKSGELQK